ncbi:MAG: hypothetical protein [Bacteriophage sp.]|nr:MAG: hypothetical protein [Bacteriophage sp.]
MTDLTNTIEAKSDQLGADDLMSGPRNIKITKVSADTGSSEQPIVINFEGDNRKPWKPCKSMRRLLVAIWGPNGNEYVGRSVTLYRDPTVKWGGMEVGGIRISHMSHIDKAVTIALTATRGNKRPTTVQPLVMQDKPATDPYANYAKEFKRRLDNEPWQAVDSWWSNTEAEREGMAQERVDKMSAALAAKIEKASA